MKREKKREKQKYNNATNHSYESQDRHGERENIERKWERERDMQIRRRD